MGKWNDLATAEKPKITMLLIEEMSTLKISKELCRDYRTIKKAVEIITKLRILSKERVFKKMLPSDKQKLKQVTTKQSL